MQQILTGIEFGRHRTNALFPEPDAQLGEIADALSLIQRHTGALFAWPEMISALDQIQIDNVLDIIHSGRVSLELIEISLPIDGVSKFAADWNCNPGPAWHVANYQETIMGVPVSLGPVEIDCANSQIELANPTAGDGDKAMPTPANFRAAVIKPTAGMHLEAIFSKFPPPQTQAP
jgi:hypothetical protein